METEEKIQELEAEETEENTEVELSAEQKIENFKKLGIKEGLLRVLIEQGFSKPTEIQEKTIPLVLEGKDIIGGAATGSGKTLAFGAGIVEKCNAEQLVQALVLVPTRELAEQVSRELRKFSKYKGLGITAVYGGVSINPQFEAIQEADVVVGTPGRILDHLERGSLKLKAIKILVLDETDRMLDMGFIEDVERIVAACNKFRQTMLFSATIPPEIARLARKYMSSPIEVNAESQVDPTKLKQAYYDVPDSLKFSLLAYLLKQEHKGLIMVFCNTQRNTDFVVKNLQSQGINAKAVHGGLSQDKRNKTMKLFHSKDVNVLVCTDVAARGLDIKGVSHVYNYDVPNELNNYVHRIGRTARAGADGIAITILASRDYDQFGRLLRTLGVEIERRELPDIQRVNLILDRPRGYDRDSRGFGGRDSRRNDRRRGGSSGGRFGRSSRPSSHGGSGGGYGLRRGGGAHRQNSKMQMRNSKRMWR